MTENFGLIYIRQVKENTMKDDTKAIKLAKLIILVTDREVDADTKAFSVKAAIQSGVITMEDAIEILANNQVLDEFRYG